MRFGGCGVVGFGRGMVILASFCWLVCLLGRSVTVAVVGLRRADGWMMSDKEEAEILLHIRFPIREINLTMAGRTTFHLLSASIAFSRPLTSHILPICNQNSQSSAYTKELFR